MLSNSRNFLTSIAGEGKSIPRFAVAPFLIVGFQIGGEEDTLVDPELKSRLS